MELPVDIPLPGAGAVAGVAGVTGFGAAGGAGYGPGGGGVRPSVPPGSCSVVQTVARRPGAGGGAGAGGLRAAANRAGVGASDGGDPKP